MCPELHDGTTSFLYNLTFFHVYGSLGEHAKELNPTKDAFLEFWNTAVSCCKFHKTSLPKVISETLMGCLSDSTKAVAPVPLSVIAEALRAQPFSVEALYTIMRGLPSLSVAAHERDLCSAWEILW